MARSKRVRVGDIFRFGIDDSRYSYGQVVEIPPKRLKYFAIFKIATTEDIELEAIANSEILILVQSMDVKINNGDWKIIGNAAVSERIHLPLYKVSTLNGWVVQNYDGTILRSATAEDMEQLNTRISYSPAAIENTVKAYFGVIPWQDSYNDLLVD